MLATATACESIRQSGEPIDDATITGRVKGRLVAEKAANLTRVDVETNAGVVYLRGVVDTAEQKARAAQVAREVRGVKSVVNHLRVQKR